MAQDIRSQIQEVLVDKVAAEDPTIARIRQLLPQMDNPIKVMKRTDLHPQVQKTLSGETAAFHTPGSTQLVVLSDSPMYRDAQDTQNGLAQRLLASVLLHEKMHDTDPGEVGPYQAQLDFLRGYQPTSGADFDKYRKALDTYTRLVETAKRGKKPSNTLGNSYTPTNPGQR